MTSIYTDGSCIPNPGPGGWAFCILENDEEICISGSEKHSTNNRMELQAVIEALNCVNPGNYIIYTDSQLTMNCAKGLYKRKKNIDLWAEFDIASKGKKLKWVWVKAHNGNKYNEIVDSMAKSEAQSLI